MRSYDFAAFEIFSTLPPSKPYFANTLVAARRMLSRVACAEASRTPVRRVAGLGALLRAAALGSAIAASWLLLGEGAFDHEVARRRRVAFLEAARLEDVLEVDQQARAAAQHHAVFGGIERRQAEVVGELVALDQLGDAAHVAELLARHGRVVEQLLFDHLAQDLVA